MSVNSSLFWSEGSWIIVIIAVALALEAMIFFLISPKKERSVFCSFCFKFDQTDGEKKNEYFFSELIIENKHSLVKWMNRYSVT